MDLLELIKSDKSITFFRDALLEASRNFAVGSVADVIYKFHAYLQEYYEDLLVHEFQLYSDRPVYILLLREITGSYGDAEHFEYSFEGRSVNLNDLKELNDVPFTELNKLEFKYSLSPELKYMVQQVNITINKDLFAKDRNFAVNRGDDTFVKGSFKITWDDEFLTCTLQSYNYANTVYHGAPPTQRIYAQGTAGTVQGGIYVI